MIRSYADRPTRELFEDRTARWFGSIARIAMRKLQQLNAAAKLEDLMSPPGNCLEALKGNRKGQHSIRVNDQFRICFRWQHGDAYEVEIADYH